MGKKKNVISFGVDPKTKPKMLKIGRAKPVA